MAVSVVAVLSVATRSWPAALLALGLYGAYVAVGFERVYGVLSRRLSLGAGSEFVVRTAGFVGGAVLLTVALSALSALPGAGAFGALEAGSNPFLAWLLDGTGLVSLGMAALAVSGVVVAYEGATMLVRRFVVARAAPFVGGAATSGLVALTGSVRATSRMGAPGGGIGEASTATGNAQSRSGSGDRGSLPGADDVATDGGTADVAAGGDDPFEGTPFEPMGSAPGTSGFDPGPATFGDPTAAERPTGSSRMSHGDGGVVLQHRADATAGAPALQQYGATDPVVVDGDTGAVVATREECASDGWRRAVVDWLATSFEERHGADLREIPEADSRLRAVADRARSDLAERTDTEILLPFIADVGEGATHIRRTLSTASPPDGGRPRPPFEGIDASGTTGATTAGADRDLDVEIEDAPLERTVEAPLTGEECVAYRFRAWERDRVGLDGLDDRLSVTTRRPTARDDEEVAFEVESFGTPVRVDADVLRLAAAESTTDRGADGIAYEESIAPGDTVTVVGDIDERRDGLVLSDVGGEGAIVTTGQSGDLTSGLTKGGLGRLAGGGGVAVFAAASTPVVATGTLLAGAVGVGAIAGTLRWNLHGRLAGSLPVDGAAERLPVDGAAERLPDDSDLSELPAGALARMSDCLRTVRGWIRN